MGKYPKCFGSLPNQIEYAENNCHTCKYNNKCSQQSFQNIIKMANECIGNQNWIKEIEDYIDYYGQDDGGLDILNNKLTLSELVDKYIGLDTKVKIKCRKGCIQIERID